MGKKDFSEIKLTDSDNDFDFNAVAHDSTPNKKAYKTTTPKRVNYCIRLQPSIKEALDIYLTKNHLKISDYLEALILGNIKGNK